MSVTYPFIPKSNSKLQKGHFWPLMLSNGMFGCGVVLDTPERGKYKTKLFFAGLLDWIGTQKPTTEVLEASQIRLLDQGQVNINTILRKSEAIEGLIDLDHLGVEIALQVDPDEYDNKCSYVFRGYEVIRKATREDYKTLESRSTGV